MKIIYDGHCPFCHEYVRLVRIRKVVGSVELIDLRVNRECLTDLLVAGVDPDQGMIVEHFGRRYYGADAIQMLAMLSANSSFLAIALNRLMSSSWMVGALYPLLRIGRNLVLLALGRETLVSSKEEPADRLLFFVFGFFAFLHLLVYQYQYGAPIYYSTYLLAGIGVLLILGIRQRLLFVLLVGLMLVDGILQMPALSNHTILKNFFLVGVSLAGIYHALRAGRWGDFWADVLPVGRMLLVVMYFFGVFHKINSGFIDPASSCAMALWAQMPGWLGWIQGPLIQYSAIYGTFLIESLLVVLLFVPRLRHIGIACGMVFHLLLALSGYAMYAPFSFLSVFLHLCFLSPEASRRVIHSREWRAFERFLRRPAGLSVLAMLLAMAYLGAWSGRYADVTYVCLIAIAPLLYCVLRYGRDANAASTAQFFVSPRRWLFLVVLLFFFNCSTPYLGLKTAQSMNMFANLRLEAGQSNHLLIRGVGPFGYLDDVVEVVESSGSYRLDYVRREGLGLVYYSLLDELERRPGARVSFHRNGELLQAQSVETLRHDIAEILHPRWFRAWFHFAVVDFSLPKPCALDR